MTSEQSNDRRPSFDLKWFAIALVIVMAGLGAMSVVPDRYSGPVFWLTPVMAGLAVGARVRRPFAHAALAGALGLVLVSAIPQPFCGPDPHPEPGRNIIALCFFAALYGSMAGVAARLVSLATRIGKASPESGEPPQSGEHDKPN